jgi:hypothetical protein
VLGLVLDCVEDIALAIFFVAFFERRIIGGASSYPFPWTTSSSASLHQLLREPF